MTISIPMQNEGETSIPEVSHAVSTTTTDLVPLPVEPAEEQGRLASSCPVSIATAFDITETTASLSPPLTAEVVEVISIRTTVDVECPLSNAVGVQPDTLTSAPTTTTTTTTNATNGTNEHNRNRESQNCAGAVFVIISFLLIAVGVSFATREDDTSYSNNNGDGNYHQEQQPSYKDSAASTIWNDHAIGFYYWFDYSFFNDDSPGCIDHPDYLVLMYGENATYAYTSMAETMIHVFGDIRLTRDIADNIRIYDFKTTIAENQTTDDIYFVPTTDPNNNCIPMPDFSLNVLESSSWLISDSIVANLTQARLNWLARVEDEEKENGTTRI